MAAKNVMGKTHTLECSKKIMGKSVGYVFDLSQSSSGRETEEFIKEPASVSLAARKRIFVKFAPSIWSSDFPCKLEISVVVKMENFCSTKILPMLTTSK